MHPPSHALLRLSASALATLLAPWAGLAMAQDMPATMPAPAPACAAEPAAPPPAFAAWSNATAMDAATDEPGLAMASLAPGEAEKLTLRPTPDVHYLLRPEKPGGTVSFGGMVRLQVAKAGTYRVALGSGAWIDLLRAGKPLVSAAHGHGPACTGIRKIVDFALDAGDYVLQVAANGTPEVTVLVVPQD
ncbi:MAG: hypothetical protein OC190_03695 [Novosphingobium aromaticivorans]|nr:hypothetical protein [Novosphingobium aromaticivorans]